VVVNDELDRCVDRLRSIMMAERARLRLVQPMAEEIVKTFRKD
jgi:guanylate kinase